MTDLKWVCCPACKECTDLHRIGKVGNLYVRNKDGKMGIKHSRKVRCGFCGTIFYTDEAIMTEAMGRDSCNETDL